MLGVVDFAKFLEKQILLFEDKFEIESEKIISKFSLTAQKPFGFALYPMPT